jgi:hypothetical protein
MAPDIDGFCFVVDPNPAPDEASHWRGLTASELSRHLVDLRLAHEFGHTFFYGTDGHRLVAASAAEESFCDRFAEELVALRGNAGLRSTA